MKCRVCREGTLETRRENHRYTESGLPNVTLVDLDVRYCPHCGARTAVIPRIDELHRVLAFAVAAQRGRLIGEEIRFLRKYLGWSGEDFAGVMGVNPSTVSNWETGKEPIGPQSDRLLRAYVFRLKPVEEYPTTKFASIAQEGVAPPRFTVRGAKTNWHAEEAAA